VSSSFGECEQDFLPAANGGTDFTGILKTFHALFQQGNAQGITFLASSGDNGAPGRGNNGFCPLDPNIYCPLGGCANTATACQGLELSVAYGSAKMSCVLPLGLEGFGCNGITSIIGIPGNNLSALFEMAMDVLQTNLSITAANWDLDVEGNPHLYVPAGNTCKSIQFTMPIAAGTLKIKGYVFDPTNSAVGDTFIDEFPGSSPYVTSVGMTTINDLSQPELIGSILNGGIVTGGGGFSSINPQLSYQTKAVAAYVKSVRGKLPPSSMFDATKRAYPDISLTGERYIVVGEDNTGTLQEEVVSGTSASSPAFAGLVSLINEGRLAAGKSPLGFLNPVLYKAYYSDPTIFNDITDTQTNACTHCYCCSFGYPSAHGWDASTGLGSPNFGRLYDFAVALP